MSIRAVDNTCMRCGKPLRASKLNFVGDCCAKRYTPEQLEAMAVYAAQAADPFHIPAPLRALSAEGQRNNANLHAALAGAVQVCGHGGRIGACPACRREADPTRAAELILREILSSSFEARRADRIAVQCARRDRGIPSPARRPAPRPSLRRPAAPQPVPATPAPPTTHQLELL